MGFTKLELVQFFDGLAELVSEENRGKGSGKADNAQL